MTVLALFDIDGTLLLGGRAARQAMIRAATEIFGEVFSWEGVNAAGGLDPLLFEEAARRSGLSVGPEDHDRFRGNYIRYLEEELASSPGGVRALPGVIDLLDDLRRRPQVVLGLLTGNYGPAASLKLEAAGIPPSWFEITAVGDDAPNRAALVPIALERFRARHGRELARHQVTVIGDTPRDIECARANGARMFAVATGSFPLGALVEAGADVAVDALADPQPLLSFLGVAAP